MLGKTSSATVYPPEGGALKFDAGKNGVSKIKLQGNSLGAVDGLHLVFEDGSERAYRNMPFTYDLGKAKKEKGG